MIRATFIIASRSRGKVGGVKAKLLQTVGAVHLAAGTWLMAQTGREATMPDVPNAYVNIPYSELKSLWEAARARQAEGKDKPELPPVGHVLRRIECVLTLAGDRPGLLEASFEGEVLGEGWNDLLLMDGDMRLEQAEAGTGSVVWRDGYRWLGQGPGQLDVTARCAVGPLPDLTDPGGLRLKLGAATVKRLTVRGVPAGHEVRVGGGATRADGDGGPTFHLPGGEEPLVIVVAPVRQETAPQPSDWRMESRVVVQADEGRLRYAARVSARADTGSGLEALLDLPANATEVEAEGQDLVARESFRTPEGGKRLRLQWKTRDVLDREVLVRYSLPRSPLAETWQLQAPAVGGAASTALFAVVVPEGMVLEGDAVAAVPAHRLGTWMRELLGEAAFVTAEAAGTLELRTRWLPVVATAEALVGEAKAQLRLVDDGSMQTAVSWSIRHQAALVWQVEMPAKVDLLSCTVAGKPVKPVRREGGELEFTLPAPGEEGKGGTAVVVNYVGKTEPLDPVSGRVSLELPRTGLFIERLDWTVSIPARFEVVAVEGNVAVAGAGQGASEAGVVALRKELCRGEKPAAEFFYQRKDFSN